MQRLVLLDHAVELDAYDGVGVLLLAQARAHHLPGQHQPVDLDASRRGARTGADDRPEDQQDDGERGPRIGVGRGESRGGHHRHELEHRIAERRRQRGVEVGRDVEEGFDLVGARPIGRVLQCDDVRLVGCAEGGSRFGTSVLEGEIEARGRKLLGFPAGGQQQVFHLVGLRGDGEIEDRREAVQRESDGVAVHFARLVGCAVCLGSSDQRVVGAVEIVARLRTQVPEREVGRGTCDLRVGEERIVIAAARYEIVERTFECGRGGVVVELSGCGGCRAAGFDRQDAQGVAGFPFGREDAFADIDVGAGAVVFPRIALPFSSGGSFSPAKLTP